MGFASLGVAFVVLPEVAAAEESLPSLVRSASLDWPQWRGPYRDGKSEETGLLQAWPEGGPKRLWKVSGIGRGYSGLGDTGLFPAVPRPLGYRFERAAGD
jgi:hypothetical protein